MNCPVCKTDSLGEITLVHDLPSRQCAICAGILLSSNACMGWLRAKGDDLPEKPVSRLMNPAWAPTC